MQNFVGRTRELGELSRLIPTDGAAGGAIRVIVGHAGIGKTRLAHEVARVATERGASVVWGRCWDEGATHPYWPWLQIVRALRCSERGSDLAQLVLGAAGGVDRMELFDATSQVIEETAASSPLVIVIDDLHQADAASVALLRYVADRIVAVPVLLLATLRPPTRERHEVIAQLDALGRRAGTIELTGLAVDEVAGLIPAAWSAEQVHTATAGNPLFVAEVARLTNVDGHLDGSLIDVVRRRLDALDPLVADVISAASVLGPDASPPTIASIVGAVDVGPLIDVACAADLLAVEDDRTVVAHPLIAEAATSRLDQSHRHAYHAAAASLVSELDGRTSDVAAHLLAAGPAHRAAGIEAARAAAVAASGTMAYGEAAELLERAVGAVLADAAHDRALHLDLLLEFGDTARRANRLTDSDRAYDEAWDLALEVGDPSSIARAALRSGIRYYFSGDLSDTEVPRTMTALAALPPGPSILRARLLANLSLKLVVADPVESRRAAVVAHDMAWTLDDPATLGYVLVADQISALGPATLSTRVDTAREIVSLAHASGEPGLLVQGRFLLMGALLERGDLRGLDHELAAQHKVLDSLDDVRATRHSLWFRCMRALFDGNVVEAEKLAHACFDLSVELDDPDGIGVLGGQLGIVRWLDGRLIEMEPLYLERRAAEPNEPLWSAVLAYVWAHHGRLDAARGALAAMPPLDQIVEGQYWLLTMVSHGEAAVIVGDVQRMQAVRDMLLPYPDRIVPIGMGAALWGSVARLLGLIAVALGDHDEGVHFLRRGVAVTSRVGARPWLVQTQLDLVEVLSDGPDPDGDEIGQILLEALTTAEQLGLNAFTARAGKLRERYGPEAPPRVVDQAAPQRSPSVVVLGGLEVRSADEELASWSSRKARLLLMILVARRGVPIHRGQLAEMLWPGEDADRTRNRLDVAVSTVRRALDPRREFAAEALIESRGGRVRLRHDAVRIDLEEYMSAASERLRSPDRFTTLDLLDLANSYRGDAFPEEPYADWAEPTRTTVATRASQLYWIVARRALDDGDHLVAVEAYRRLIELDRFDHLAHLALIELFERTGGGGVLARARDSYRSAMAVLGIETLPAG